MSDDSSDCSDINTRPSGSKGRQDQKRKRRIVMRIEFDDSDDTSSASDRTSDEEEDDDVKISKNDGANDLDIAGHSCSVRLRNRHTMKNNKKYNETNNDDNDDDDSDEFHAATRRLRRSGRRANVLDVGFSDDSSSGSEITRKKSRGKKYIVSEDEREPKSPSNTTAATKNSAKQQQQDEPGFTSDSSSNELLEKCPICLLTFRRQEIGSPSTCEHIFCANCIEAWSKNVQTCPIDRIEFQRIIVRESFENRKIVREINVDPNAQKELVLDDEDIIDIEDVTDCEVCNRSDREDVMLLCDHCDQGYHMDCLSPPLSEIPEGSWFCDNCVDSEDEDEAGDVEEDLNMLYEDIRDMGIPESRLRVREVPQQPRILRTRQNERIRAAILRRTRASVARLETTTTRTTTTAQRGRPRISTTTTTTSERRSTANRNSSVGGSVRKPRKRRRRRRARQRTYVVEYDLNNFDEKFAIKTTKKVIRRRRRKARTSSRRGRRTTSSRGERMTASKRLAEQMGVKSDPKYTSHLSGSNAGLSLFGGANDLEYFSDSDGGNIESEIHIDTGHGTAVQTSVRISNYGSQRSRKGLLLGRLEPSRGIAEPVVEQNNTNPDILSSIMDMQDRWHSATRNMESVRIKTDGTLNLPNSKERANNDTTRTMPTPIGGDDNRNPTETHAQNGPSSSDINQAPLYSRGGGNPNFNRGGGGGGYNNRSNTNQSSYRGGGGNQYRNSTGGSVGGGGGNFGGSAGTNFSMVGRGNFNFSNNPNYNGPPPQQQNQQNNVSPFQQRNFNQRNQLNNTNNQRNIGNMQQRHSLPFTNNINCSDINQQQQQPIPPITSNRFGHMQQQTCLPPPPLLLNQQLTPIQQNLQQPPPMNENNSLFGGLPPPMTIPPPHLNVSLPPTVSQIPVLMSVPPPPAPPSVVIPQQVNNSLFQLNSDYGNDDDDSNCPNFAIYSHESQQVAKSTESYPANAANTANAAKEDDENEDLVQLDDDDEIPMPPEPNLSENIESAELYEPENPTEENYDEDDVENSSVKDKNVTKDDGDDFGDDNDDGEKNEKSKKDLGKELTNSDKYDPENDGATSDIDTTPDIKDTSDNKQQSNSVRSPSPATSEIRLPESESAAANRKGVLELYDDSDWEELDIDRPKENDKKNKNTAKTGGDNEENENEPEQDRSYTPCLDENNDPEEPQVEAATPGIEENSATDLSPNKNAKSATKSNKKDDRTSADENIQDMETELISEEEDDVDRNNKDRKKNHKSNNDKRVNDKRGDDNDKVETFKKIGNKQKIRNYRGDQKQPGPSNRRTNKKRRSRSPVSRSRSRSRSANSFRSRGGRSRSRSPRYRGRGDRSRSRSNNKENQGRWAGNQRDGGRFHRNNQLNQQNYRLKRRELPRYDVRNVVGHHSSPSKLVSKDRYGRDTSRNRRNTRSLSRGRRGPPPQGRSPLSRSRSRSRNRRLSISLSPSPSYSRRRSLSPANPPRRFSPARRRSISDSRRTPPFRQQRSSRSPLRVIRSRSVSPAAQHRMNGRKVTRHLRGSSQPRILNRGQRSRSLSLSPRYTPRISRSRSKTPRLKGGKKKKAKISRKKKSKRRMANMTPSPNRRISRQPDPFDIEKPPKKKRRRSPRAKSPLLEDHGWSPSPSPPPTQAIADNFDYPPDKNVSWTPPMQSPLLGLFRSGNVRSVSPSSRKDKPKRSKKKKKITKRRDGRKEKKRNRRTETPEPAPSKEVFASGNNILVSVSFNKETTLSQQHAQQTIVTLPSNRDELMSSNRRVSIDAAKRRKDKRKKIDTKPVAIIDLERSPFQVEQEPTDIIVLTDSEEANEHEQQREHRRDRHRSESSCPRDTDTENTTHRNQRSGGGASGGQRGDKSTPERMDTIHEESYDLTQTGPKTPPEPPLVKFNLQTKKQSKVRNPLHEDEDDMASDGELDERQKQQQQENHRSDMDTMHVQSSQKIGPNTPPESGPCSPDAYDPFEPTKSPSISPRSPTPPPSQLDVSQNSICGESNGDLVATQKHIDNEQQQRREQIPGLGGNIAQSASLNPVDLVMALINSKSASNNNQDLTNKSNDSQHLNSNDDLFRDKGNDEGNSITVLSNLLITSSNIQHIPSISSPTPPSAMSKKLPALPKIGGSVGGSSSSGVNVRNGGTGTGTSNNADDSFNMNDIESPYSPGSAEYDDLFEPPPEASGGTKRRSKRGKPTEMFDNLFGSSSPAGNIRLPSYTPSKKYKGGGGAVGASRKSKVKVGKSNNDDIIKVYDDVPNSAVELHVKDKFLRKLNRQERVVEEVKLILKPRFNKKQINKDDYKEIMRRAVPKICHSRSGEIDPLKIKRLIEAYVKKFRSKHKKLNIVNTGQVSSAVKCAAYLKKL